MAELPLGEFNTAPCRWRPEGCWAGHERVTVSSLITGARLDRMQRALGTLSEVLTRVQGFHNELQQELSKVPFYDLGSRLQRWFGGGLPARIRKVETIREDFRPIRERIEHWTSASDSATGAAYEQSIVVYRDLDGERALHAQHTQDLRLQRVGT